jgi:hypothetical protein
MSRVRVVAGRRVRGMMGGPVAIVPLSAGRVFLLMLMAFLVGVRVRRRCRVGRRLGVVVFVAIVFHVGFDDPCWSRFHRHYSTDGSGE